MWIIPSFSAGGALLDSRLLCAQHRRVLALATGLALDTATRVAVVPGTARFGRLSVEARALGTGRADRGRVLHGTRRAVKTRGAWGARAVGLVGISGIAVHAPFLTTAFADPAVLGRGAQVRGRGPSGSAAFSFCIDAVGALVAGLARLKVVAVLRFWQVAVVPRLALAPALQGIILAFSDNMHTKTNPKLNFQSTACKALQLDDQKK